ncbi:PTS system fructose-specific IIA component [Breznakia sp. PF5-3]|uniref:fructose PTS transporter subunit IIA n=1 Tax=unclassified Breznakia TaxID=2623764 RepID=UPI0024049A7B|nr:MULTISPECIES: fructose PTS transporter subunit IIA [unclassified Breznakia]MDF9824339.1 PTS system fructose-specific IIA component [Breznakia sp. PM6-1]MDF9835070.1 PTS system fructose-specific IIA component [Breznakia sp. PF5-3]MDF9837759.1 PTS system fructose-specific IIA component [Breznakia sp. PFB2-8]MDF9859638.1 PTS system fructose-specific IIA component [Breznakia sp. PH5-24]
MKVIDAIDERIIDLSMNTKNKKETIKALADKLHDAGYINDVGAFIKDIYEREAQGITGIGNYIAIPHGKSDSVTQVGIAIGKLNDEIEWETLDGKGVKLVFLFAVSNDHEYAKNHMKLLAEIATKLGNDEAVEKLNKMQEVSELREIFTAV